MSRAHRIFKRAVAGLAVAAVLSSCGAPATSEGSSPSVAHAEHNADDVAFAQNMIPHHRQAVVMSAMVPTRSTNPEVQQVAKSIAADQQAEIQTMTALLAQWGAPAPPDTMAGAGPHGPGMEGMVDTATMDRLKSLRGAAFDLLWVHSMIAHHQGAVSMANVEIARGRSADAVKLARLIVAAQQREISYLTGLVSVSK